VIERQEAEKEADMCVRRTMTVASARDQASGKNNMQTIKAVWTQI
jgi:hypothetical protein